MDQCQGNSHEDSLFNLLTLPTELLIYIISFLSSLRDRVKLRYVSRWMRHVTEGTPSLWKEFVWPYYDSREECSVKEVLKVCGQHVKVLSFPYCRVPSTLVEMLQYCSNVQHLSLPSTKLDPEQLRKSIHHMGCLQTLELKVDNERDIKQLLLITGQLRELSIISDHHFRELLKLFKQWKELDFRPSSFKVFSPEYSICYRNKCLADCATQPTIPTSTTANFRVYDRYSKVPLCSSPLFPYCQLKVEEFSQVTIPCVKFSDYGLLGLKNDLAVMTDCQYGGRTMYMVRYQLDVVNRLNHSMHFLCDLVCVTDVDLTSCYSLRSGHLEQLAIACPNLQRLNLNTCSHCLESLQGLQAIASHCHYLQGLNMGNICTSDVEDHVLLWKILSDMKLSHLTMEFCVLEAKDANKKTLICLYQKCWTIRRIQCGYCSHCRTATYKDTLMLSYFPSLIYCYLNEPAMVQDLINNCKKLKYFVYSCNRFYNH
ncbi:uncharacterized protein [Dysidea avara]|uniref:uncharacterized protein n=1 Tax=Dysidea avara TaxID=196820 RepID=UPI0033299567